MGFFTNAKPVSCPTRRFPKPFECAKFAALAQELALASNVHLPPKFVKVRLAFALP